MSELAVAVLGFLSMMGAALLGLFCKTRLPSEHLHDGTRSAVGLMANLFIVMTSLVLGLMLNSAKNTFETNSRDIRTLATELILLDRTMRALGPEAEDARRHLVEYVQTSRVPGRPLPVISKLASSPPTPGWAVPARSRPPGGTPGHSIVPSRARGSITPFKLTSASAKRRASSL